MFFSHLEELMKMKLQPHQVNTMILQEEEHQCDESVPPQNSGAAAEQEKQEAADLYEVW